MAGQGRREARSSALAVLGDIWTAPKLEKAKMIASQVRFPLAEVECPLYKVDSRRENKMLMIDETTDRATLECAAIDADLDLGAVEAATDHQLLEMVQSWIAAGDECAQ